MNFLTKDRDQDPPEAKATWELMCSMWVNPELNAMSGANIAMGTMVMLCMAAPFFTLLCIHPTELSGVTRLICMALAALVIAILFSSGDPEAVEDDTTAKIAWGSFLAAIALCGMGIALGIYRESRSHPHRD